MTPWGCAKQVLKVKKRNVPQVRKSTFGSSDVEKVHRALARSLFRSQNVQNTPAGPLCKLLLREVYLEINMLKTLRPLWGEAYFQVKKVRTAFGKWV